MSFHTVLDSNTNILSSSVNYPVENKLFHELFEEFWLEWSDREAFTDAITGETLTYNQLLVTVKSLAAKIQSLGVKENDFVIFSARATYKSCLTILALFFAKTQVLVSKYGLTLFEVESYFKDISAKHVFSDEASLEKWKEFAKGHHSAKDVYCIEDESMWNGDKHLEYKKPSKSDAKTTNLLMTFTSGSTGPSKAVMLTHYNMSGNCWPLALKGTVEDCVHLLSNPLSHLSGVYIMLQPLQFGGKLVIAPDNMKDDIEEYARVVSTYKCTHILAMPVTFKILTDNTQQIGDRFSSVTHISTGGSPLPEPLLQKLHKSFPHIVVHNLYGMSETNGFMAMAHNAIYDKGLQIIPNHQVRIEDVNTRKALGPNQPGEILIKGPLVFMGYLNRKDATSETISEDGWLRSGDVGYYRDTDYGLMIVDRLKQMIKCLDNQVTPAELEQLLLENDKVLNALVVGVPHEKYGEAPTAFIAPKDINIDLRKLSQELIEDVKSKLSHFKQLFGGVYFVKEMPRTDSGKFSRTAILQSFLKNELKTIKY